jgi:hypothetical protein
VFSLDNYYKTIYFNLLEPLNIGQVVIEPTDDSNFSYYVYSPTYHGQDTFVGHEFDYPNLAYFNDQEPHSSEMYFEYNQIHWYDYVNTTEENVRYLHGSYNKDQFNLYATSEKSVEVNNFCSEYSLTKWYYFSHGLIAQYWFNNFKYFPVPTHNKFDKVFITFNNLISNNRSYRLNLVADLVEKNIADQGYISLSLKDNYGSWHDELFKNKSSRLGKDAKIKIYKNLKDIDKPLTIDIEDSHGALSASGGYEDLALFRSAMWHLVTETVFYDSKLHLTEKIFKPIVARRPFILVGAPGNLQYLKDYGFKTFSKYIDESYDLETDPDIRLAKITTEIEKLCDLPRAELEDMFDDMQDILEFNFNWFYNDFKHLVVDEMLRNYRSNIVAYNQYQTFSNKLSINSLNFPDISKRFTS